MHKQLSEILGLIAFAVGKKLNKELWYKGDPTMLKRKPMLVTKIKKT